MSSERQTKFKLFTLKEFQHNLQEIDKLMSKFTGDEWVKSNVENPLVQERVAEVSRLANSIKEKIKLATDEYSDNYQQIHSKSKRPAAPYSLSLCDLNITNLLEETFGVQLPKETTIKGTYGVMDFTKIMPKAISAYLKVEKAKKSGSMMILPEKLYNIVSTTNPDGSEYTYLKYIHDRIQEKKNQSKLNGKPTRGASAKIEPDRSDPTKEVYMFNNAAMKILQPKFRVDVQVECTPERVQMLNRFVEVLEALKPEEKHTSS